MNAPKRLSIKLFAENADSITPDQIVPVFQQWIQQSRVEGLLIDVADYQHVHQGPGIILIGHEGDYAYDLGDDRPGIQYTLKQAGDLTLTEAITITLRRVLHAAQQLQSETTLSGLKIDISDLQLVFRDRLAFPNSDAVAGSVHPVIQQIITEFDGAEVDLTRRVADARAPLQFQVTITPEAKAQI